MTYAVIQTGGKQYKVKASEILKIEKLENFKPQSKIEFKEKPRNKISLVYHTTPWRGLKHLLKIFKNLKLKNVELNVCSSTIIYGKKFDKILGKK